MRRIEVRFISVRIFLTAALFLALALLLSAFAADGRSAAEAQESGASLRPGAVFGMSNDPTNNEVVAFSRGADGLLTPAGSFPTGGTGSGTIEDSANGLILANRSGESSPNNLQGTAKFLFATNAGSDSVSVFRVEPDGLELVDVEPSNGQRPTSVTVSKGVVYVMNSGGFMCSGTEGPPNITGFRLDGRGELTPIPGSTRPLSGAPLYGCNQVSFNKSGDVVIVTQQQADIIDTFIVNKDGTLDGPTPQQSTGNGPFGFAFTQRGQLVTTENFGAAPGQGGAASYDIEKDGTLTPLSPTVRNGQSDTCWVVITDDNRYAYTASFGDDGAISSYRVEPDGNLALLNGQEDTTGPGTADSTLSGDSKYLYVRNSNRNTISVFRVENDGGLTRIQEVQSGAPSGGALGIAAK
ncbi:MAG: beta-propeller fold lactonase family protein [Acidobacteria bacterium]|nr:beta-propeller fold lactonase family protein [Acidobacteriota bacterium]